VQASVEEKTPIVKQAPPVKTKPEVEAAQRIQKSAKPKAEVASVDHIPKTAKRKTERASTEAEPVEIPVSTKPASPTGNGSQTLTRALGLKVARIVIDPGHGGFDTGTIGPTGLEEKNLVLDIALRLRKLIETQTDSQVVMTRSTDKFIPLEERTAIANEKDADLFISIHANASRDHHVRGIETYFLNFTTDPEALELAARENATSQESVHQLQNLIKKIALSDKVDESQELARDVQTVLYKDMSRASHGIHNRGVRKAPFVVLIGANMPSILAEISFLSNPHSEHLLKEPSYREQIAKALFQGIEDYVNNLGSVRVAQRTR
jgi:N-acetylmuramoyl-L-alanine amidase